MTLVITALKPDFVVQVSDMRLTDLSSLAVRHEEQRKAIVLHTADTRVVVGWCGFAHDRHNRNNTGDWLMDVLPRLAAKQPPLILPNFVNELVASATAQFQSIAEPLDDKACSIIMAGWAAPRPRIAVPFAVRVSNCEDENWQRLTHARPTFDQGWLLPSEKKATRVPAMVLFSGAQQATTPEQGNALRQLLRRDPTPTEVMNACLRVMREAAAHPTYGDLIGRNYVVVEMRLNSPETLAHYFPEYDSPQQFMPNLVTPVQAVKDVRIWAGPGNPPWWNH
jgi:hypothetical protein